MTLVIPTAYVRIRPRFSPTMRKFALVPPFNYNLTLHSLWVIQMRFISTKVAAKEWADGFPNSKCLQSVILIKSLSTISGLGS